MCISVSQLVRNIGITVFAGIVFVRLWRLNVITWQAKRAHSGEVDRKLPRMPAPGECTDDLQTLLKKEMVAVENPPRDTLVRLMKKRMQIRRPKERNMDLHAPCLVNSCQGKDGGVLFILNYPFHQHTGIGCDTILDSRNYFQSC